MSFLPLSLIILSILSSPAQLSENIPQFKAKDINGQLIGEHIWQDKFSLFLFFDPSRLNHKAILKYAQVLLNRYRPHNLTIIGISSANEERLKQIQRLCDLTFPLVADLSHQIYGQFNLGRCCGATVFALPNGNIIFKANILISPENLRQLVEKNLLGKIDYEFSGMSWNSLYKPGDIFPDQQVFDMAANKHHSLSSLAKDILIITFLSSFCSSCNHGERLKTLQRLGDHLRSRIILGFLEPFEAHDVRQLETYVKSDFRKYIFKNIFSDDQIYITDEKLKCEPWTIVISKDRKVLFAEIPGQTESEISSAIKNISESANHF